MNRKWWAMLLCLGMTLAPSVSLASSSCECFCGEVGYGATSVGIMAADACQQTCRDIDVQYVGCFTESSEYPYNSPKCWTKKECDAFSEQNIDGDVIGGTWGTDMPYDCSITKSSNEQMRYCYADDVPYDLNISIGSVTQVQNFPEYINLVYAWLLPAAALIAVVMMMLGGLQYILSRGKEKYISKGKDRIVHAITGLVILLSIFVLLNLIDPRLTVFNPLKVPLVKEVVMLDTDSSCERLSDYGYTVEPATSTTSALCGGQGKITSDEGLSTNALGTWNIGDLCDYMYCDDYKSCVAQDGKNSCKTCFEISTPTAETCASAEIFDAGSRKDTQIYCAYNSTFNSCTTAGTNLGTTASSPQGFYCEALRTYAKQTVNGTTTQKGCDVYDDLQFGYSIFESPNISDIHNVIGAELLARICTEDVCGIGEILSTGTDIPLHCVYQSLDLDGDGEKDWFDCTSAM